MDSGDDGATVTHLVIRTLVNMLKRNAKRDSLNTFNL